MLQKLVFRWLSLCKIYNIVKKKKIYMLERLDKSHLAGTFAKTRFKKFHYRK